MPPLPDWYSCAMPRRFLNELADGERVDEIYLASEKQLRPNRAGNLYLQVRLADRTGSLNCMLWNAEQVHYESFNNGDYVRVRGNAQLYNERMQLIVRSLEVVESGSVDVADFEAVTEADVRALSERLVMHLRAIGNLHLRCLAECVMVDEGLMARFKRAPAGIKNHHAWHGGLLEHVVQLIDLAAVVAPLYAELDSDLLVTGVLFHDLGKTEELSYEPDFSYTDAGQLLGHLVQGVAILERKIMDCEKQSGERFPEELALRLKHMIVSHHGELEMGSPRVPMTPEALVLHFLDNMDAKLASVRQILAEDANHGSAWTVYNAQLGRKIFKGLPPGR